MARLMSVALSAKLNGRIAFVSVINLYITEQNNLQLCEFELILICYLCADHKRQSQILHDGENLKTIRSH